MSSATNTPKKKRSLGPYANGRKNPGPTKYDPIKHPEKARKLAYLGATMEEIAEQFDVTVRTLTYWSHCYPEFAQSMVLGKDYSDNRVIHSLYKRALGFEHTIEEQVLGRDGQPILDNEGNPVVIGRKVFQPPDTSAITFWLKNRRRDDWTDRQQLEVGKAGEFDRMSDSELLAFVEDGVIDGEVVDADDGD